MERADQSCMQCSGKQKLKHERKQCQIAEQRVRNLEIQCQALVDEFTRTLTGTHQELEREKEQSQTAERRARNMEIELTRTLTAKEQELEREKEQSQIAEQRARNIETELTRTLTATQQELEREKEQSQTAERRARNTEEESTRTLTATQQELNQTRELAEQELQVRQRRIDELTTTLATGHEAASGRSRITVDLCHATGSSIEMKYACPARALEWGGWGTVVEGTFRGTKVAVKQIHELILSPYNRRLFEREMNIASRCRHPCLLQFIGATNDDGSPLFVTELMETSLRNVLRQRSLTSREVLVISADVARALNYLHHNRPTPIIHRDVSSANVLLWRHGETWRGKVSDYGTANFVQQEMTTAAGAPPYCAPEALTSAQSPKLDVYSFGALLCEMCIRELPDPTQREQQIMLVANHVFRDLIRRCVQQNPKSRPTMEEILQELEA